MTTTNPDARTWAEEFLHTRIFTDEGIAFLSPLFAAFAAEQRSEAKAEGMREMQIACANVCRAVVNVKGDGVASVSLYRYFGNEQCAEAIESLQQSAALPSDYVMVPSEPTMGQWDDFCAVFPVPFDKFQLAYKAMLAATGTKR